MIFDYSKGLSADAMSALDGSSGVQLVSQATKQIDKVMFSTTKR